MPRQPYSAAVPSTGGRLHPSRLRREGLVRMWSSLWLKGDGGIRKTFFNDKEGFCPPLTGEPKGGGVKTIEGRFSKNITFSKYSFVSIILFFKNSDAKVNT